MQSRHKPSQTSRRSFLKRAGAAGVAAGVAGGLQILPSGAWGQSSQSLNVALLACGGRTRQLLPSILRGGGRVVAMCDVDQAQVNRLRQSVAQDEKFAPIIDKAKVYEDYRTLLEQEKSVDAVVVAPGQRWHAHMSKAAMLAGKHVFCEKPLVFSCAEARQMRDLGRQTRLATQVGSQGGASDTFRRAMEIIQAGLLGQVREVHAWINRSFPTSAPIDRNADPIPAGVNWDAWCGPSPLLPFKRYYLGGCLAWGRWLDFGDGHLADMGAHGLNLPWRALKLGAPLNCSVEHPEPLKDSYPSANRFRWDFAARPGMDPVSLYWHDGRQAGPPEEHAREYLSNYPKPPGDGVMFIGEQGVLCSGAWGTGGILKLKGEPRFRGVLDHEAAKPLPMSVPRRKGQNHMEEWLDACRGNGTTFQGFDTAAMIAEIATVGIVALRLGRPIEWDSDNLKVKGVPEAEPLVMREPRRQWL
jgi:hypothetical protein